MNRAIDQVVSRLAEPLPLDALARAARLSPFHFHRVFQALVGETPAEFVKRLRLEKALGMMSHAPRTSLTEIALACGFSSSSDFSRCFKQRFGVPPSVFNIKTWSAGRKTELETVVAAAGESRHVQKLPPRSNPDHFRVKIRDLPPRNVAYICVTDPYASDAPFRATERLVAWGQQRNMTDHQWLGYQWDNPEITALKDCRYYTAVECPDFVPQGEIGKYRFPAMTVAQVEMRGDIHLEMRALQWLYGTWLPRSGYVPDDQPCFEAWIGLPFAHGFEHFELYIHLPIKPGKPASRSRNRQQRSKRA